MEHDTYNPYTVCQRYPSQWWIWAPNAPSIDAIPRNENVFNNTTMLTVSHDAVNCQSVMPSSSIITLQERYVVPEVIPFGSSSEVDTRSAGNPYAHHPNFTTPSEYFDHITDSAEAPRDVLTAMDIKGLEDPFVGGEAVPKVHIHPPNDVTINKTAFTSESIAHINSLDVSFPTRASAPAQSQVTRTNATLNKKMLSPESMYELEKIDGDFQKPSAINMHVFREFSPQTLADLREIRNISQYTDFPRSSKDVDTCLGISPTISEKAWFERTESMGYAGM
ncbi:hypothetical protein GCK72_010845 [Caenorhabditis remanei]|uniref:Uncharacterized protein n=1 Tax=Caenorhabditis remanei TaxID=31234 RepID=A0A6A5H7U9_CAERE|nr:hypothetical protein GCK72_010845 [Caenorhabditis remanei]KAF1762583.1 hypothetical protein GCK72_010845 [Caenorhabditis remanei]